LKKNLDQYLPQKIQKFFSKKTDSITCLAFPGVLQKYFFCNPEIFPKVGCQGWGRHQQKGQVQPAEFPADQI
jgi:hypothetical protein